MSITHRGIKDGAIDQLLLALAGYEALHGRARIDVYRQNPASLRARIVDPDFSGVGRGDRHDLVWSFIEGLPDEIQSQVSLLVLLTPEETTKSFANLEFDNPVEALGGE